LVVESSGVIRSQVGSKPRNGKSFVDRTGEITLSDETVGAALMRLAAEASERPAVMWAASAGAQYISWANLYERARRGAAALTDLNPCRARVAVAALNSLDWIIAMYACALAGMPIVPLSASGTSDEARYQLGHAQVGLVLAAKTVGERRLLADLVTLVHQLDRRVAVHDIAELDAQAALSPVAVAVDDEFLVQYTSGTTGLPKAASLSHRAAMNCGAVFSGAWRGGPEDRFLNPLPLHHVGGSVTGVVTSLAMGGTYILVERFSPQALVDAFRHTRPSIAGMVPTMMIDLLGMPGVTAADFASVRTIIGGATAVDPALVAEMEHRLGVTIIGSYGQSEAPAVLASSPDDSLEIRMQTLGRALAGRAVAIRSDAGDIVTTGTVGELCVRGALTMTGYVQPDGSVDSAVDSEGWRGTGDLCAMDDDGIIRFCGRIREVIIRGGLNIYPAEVEQALSTHESVAEIAVFGVSDDRLGELVVAAVIPSAGGLDVPGLIELAAKRLSSYKRPGEWIAVTTLPRTSTGKVRKHQLRAWYETGSLNANCGTAPAS
jgi:fatty-acyl-CoA synthase